MQKILLSLCLLFVFPICTPKIFGQISYNDVAPAYGLDHLYGLAEFGGGLSFADFNDDGLDDLTLASQAGFPLTFYQNTGTGFQELTPPLVDNSDEVKSILWADYDNDGDKDLFFSYSVGGVKLFQNDGSMNMVDVSVSSGMPDAMGYPDPKYSVYGLSMADVDHDGWLDLFISCRRCSNRLYKNNGDGTFTESTAASGLVDPEYYTFCSGFFDYNNDGWIDCYLANDKDSPNQLFENNGDGTFSDVSSSTGSDIIINAMCVAVGDINEDMASDIYVTNTTPGSAFLVSNGDDTFSEEAAAFGLGFYGIGWAANFFDFDHDQDEDLYVSGISYGFLGIGSKLYENQGDTFTVMSNGMAADTTESFSHVLGDYNADGFMDIAVCNTGISPMMLWSSAGGSGSWLQVETIGTMSNKDGIGTKIIVYAGGQAMVRTRFCGIGYLGQNADYAHFGLAEHFIVDSMAVYWPSGQVDHYTEMCANRKIKITEGNTSNVITPIFSNESSVYIHDNWLSYQWYLDGVPIDGATGNSYIPEESGAYSVSISTIEGCNFTAGPLDFSLPVSSGGSSFSDIAPTLGINHTYGNGTFGGGVSFVDFNADGLDDITATSQLGDPLSFYQNTGSGFDLIPSLIDDTLESRSVLWADYDNDGDKDLFLSLAQGGVKLYENDGSLNLTELSGTGFSSTLNESYGITAADFDHDGYLDIFVSCWLDQNKLYRNNNGSGSFSDVTIAAGVEDTDTRPSFCSGFFDYNLDGWLDLYLANDKFDANQLFENNGDGTFTDVSAGSGADIIIDAMCVAIGDYNNDNYEDLYISNTPSGNVLLHNNGDETFTDVSAAAGVSYGLIGWASTFFDSDLDGDLDIYLSGAQPLGPYPSVLYLNNGVYFDPEYFIGDTTFSYSHAIGDFNEDGRMDIVVNNDFPNTMNLWQNNGVSGNWLKVELEGTVSNRDGIGSRLVAYAEGVEYTRTRHCGIGYLGQNASYIHFGLAANEVVDSLLVFWPSGIIDKFENICVNRRLFLEEGEPLSDHIEITISDGTTLTAPEGFQEYVWFLDGSFVTGGTSNTYDPLEDGVYTLLAGNSAGCYTDGGPINFGEVIVECTSSSLVDGLDAASNSTGKTVHLSWNSLQGADFYHAKGRLTGTVPFGNFVTPNTYKNVGGLTPGAIYEYKMRARCAESHEITDFSPLHTFQMNEPPSSRYGNINTGVYIVPNPANSFIDLRVSTHRNSRESYSFQIINDGGKKMKEGYIKGSESRIGIKDLANGTYMVLIIDDSGQPIHSLSFVKL